MGELVGERRRETEKEREIERERKGSETDVPKLYPTMNMNSLWCICMCITTLNLCTVICRGSQFVDAKLVL